MKFKELLSISYLLQNFFCRYYTCQLFASVYLWPLAADLIWSWSHHMMFRIISSTRIFSNIIYLYRPQRSWGNVIFSEACVKNSVHGGGGSTWAGTPLGQVHPQQVQPSCRYTPQAGTPPGAVHVGVYGQQAGGTHPTGMHSCGNICSSIILTCSILSLDVSDRIGVLMSWKTIE